ncbi:MAG: CopG family transcriptional regulator [Mesorhizobium amorphae]|nr:MAG: CopG family transcriptional regulator [Mesorhizobium amorphae]
MHAFLEAQDARRRLLAERRAEADKGEFISEEAMTRWVDSWGTDQELPPPEPDLFMPQKAR